MNKFWEWMNNDCINKNVYCDSKWMLVQRDKNGIDTYTFSKQMLIGYMIEYLVYNDYMIVDDIFYHGCPNGIYDVYNHLKQIIERG
jgi:hypothetical protein